MKKQSAARTAFTIANEIKASLADLLTALDQLADDDSYTAVQRHMIMSQVCAFFSLEAKQVDKFAEDFLETYVEHCTAKEVPSFTIRAYDDEGGDSSLELLITGKTYHYGPTRSAEVLNKDTKSWGILLNRLVEVGMADAVQQRITLSKVDDNAKLEKLCGLVGIKITDKWMITEPKKTGKKR